MDTVTADTGWWNTVCAWFMGSNPCQLLLRYSTFDECCYLPSYVVVGRCNRTEPLQGEWADRMSDESTETIVALLLIYQLITSFIVPLFVLFFFTSFVSFVLSAFLVHSFILDHQLLKAGETWSVIVGCVCVCVRV